LLAVVLWKGQQTHTHTKAHNHHHNVTPVQQQCTISETTVSYLVIELFVGGGAVEGTAGGKYSGAGTCSVTTV
jgi:hypothetical protein